MIDELNPVRHKFILRTILTDPTEVTKKVMQRFEVTRPTALRWIQRLIDENLVEAVGNTRGRTYRLRSMFNVNFSRQLDSGLAEDRLWRKEIEPHLKPYRPEAQGTANYVFTEMVNNVIDHSGADEVHIFGGGDACEVSLTIADNGVGIFRKIMEHCDLEDERHAVLELSKGKLTTDPNHHSGEGIFFSSRACRAFSIRSGKHLFKREEKRNDWILDTSDEQTGTVIEMRIDVMSPVPIRRVFDKYTANDEDFGFNKTHVPVHLIRYQNEGLFSRSQAKRLLARFERFEEVHMNFQGIAEIGQAFADEIFRVFSLEHPEVQLYYHDATPEVESMIRRALGKGGETNPWTDEVAEEPKEDGSEEWHLRD